jgi:hypothetical protein
MWLLYNIFWLYGVLRCLRIFLYKILLPRKTHDTFKPILYLCCVHARWNRFLQFKTRGPQIWDNNNVELNTVGKTHPCSPSYTI